jgi:hypothetical protein
MVSDANVIVDIFNDVRERRGMLLELLNPLPQALTDHY